MPRKSEKMIIAGTKFDRRRKLTEEQKDHIAALKGTVSQRKCAEMFSVSRRTIVFFMVPRKENRKHYEKTREGRMASILQKRRT